MAREYRIVRDGWLGFEVQSRRWWFPFWLQCGFSNTHSSIGEAEAYAAQHAAGRFRSNRRRGGVVKFLGVLQAANTRPDGEGKSHD